MSLRSHVVAVAISCLISYRPVDHHPDYIGTPLLVMTYEPDRHGSVNEGLIVPNEEVHGFRRTGLYVMGALKRGTDCIGTPLINKSPSPFLIKGEGRVRVTH